MIGVLILVSIFILVIFISRNNFKKRYNELRTNLENFNKDIKNSFYSMPKDKQEKFLSLLSDSLKINFESILNDTFNYANNTWAIQQQIINQQELFIELNKFIRK